jgi:electron transfer flavoprotein beta subunit
VPEALRLLVCVKRVPAPGARINVTADGLAVDAAHLGFTTSPHEECALEAAVQLAEATEDATVTVLTLGPPEAEEQLRYAASVGADRLVLVATDDGGGAWDPQRTAAALAAAIESLEGEGGPFDLILFGNESADSGGFQVGIRVANALGRPIVNGIKDIEVEPDVVLARRPVDEGFDLDFAALVHGRHVDVLSGGFLLGGVAVHEETHADIRAMPRRG